LPFRATLKSAAEDGDAALQDSGPQISLLEVFKELSEIPFREVDQTKPLSRIVRLAKRVLGSRICTITLVDIGNRKLYQVACAGFDNELDKRWSGKIIQLGIPGKMDYVDLDLFTKGNTVEKYDLKNHGQGVARPETARRYDLNRALCFPLRSGGRLLGYINHFSSGSNPFTATERTLLQVFARQAVLCIETERQQSLERTLPILNEVLRSLSSLSPGQFLQRVADGVCDLLDASTCVVWEYDNEIQRLRVAAASEDMSVDDEYRNMTLDPSHPVMQQRLMAGHAAEINDVTSSDAAYLGKDEAARHGWVSLLTVPIYVDERLTGMLDAYAKKPRDFRQWEKDALGIFANETALSLHQFERRVEEMNRIVQTITESRDKKELFEIALTSALRLVGCERGWISLLNVRTGELEFVAHKGGPTARAPVKLGQGISGKALQDEKPWRVGDVRKNPDYEEFWPDTRSEMAIPLVIKKAEVRKGRKVEHRSKRIGVLNVESPTVGAFFSLDEDRLLTLASETAMVFERLDTDRKWAGLSRMETEILEKRDFELTVQRVLGAIMDLGYQFVNISLVDQEARRIRAQYVAGLTEEEKAQFKKLADHSLDSSDIQADIVRSEEIEVPEDNDPRLDRKVYDTFNHQRLIRVFIPMVSRSTNRVVGTVEAGYQKQFRPFIYERDVRILRDFVEFVTEAIEQRREAVLATIVHEFRSPVAAIRSNVNFLSDHLRQLPDHIIKNKFDDLALDVELALLQVSAVERVLGGATPKSTPQRTVVYRDIIIKTVNQLKPEIAGKGYDSSKIQYSVSDVGRMVLYLDPAKLNQVVFNLLRNSIKYAEDDPTEFGIHIDMEENREQFIIKFKDWGIGIKQEFAEKVFEQGFRTPEAKAKFVEGSGLGLGIARGIMRELGGDLQLSGLRKPTEFRLILPKKLKEVRR
jgi:signal transduction histidine kinase/GAF domain-containing protein